MDNAAKAVFVKSEPIPTTQTPVQGFDFNTALNNNSVDYDALLQRCADMRGVMRD